MTVVSCAPPKLVLLRVVVALHRVSFRQPAVPCVSTVIFGCLPAKRCRVRTECVSKRASLSRQDQLGIESELSPAKLHWFLLTSSGSTGLAIATSLRTKRTWTCGRVRGFTAPCTTRPPAAAATATSSSTSVVPAGGRCSPPVSRPGEKLAPPKSRARRDLALSPVASRPARHSAGLTAFCCAAVVVLGGTFCLLCPLTFHAGVYTHYGPNIAGHHRMRTGALPFWESR